MRKEDEEKWSKQRSEKADSEKDGEGRREEEIWWEKKKKKKKQEKERASEWEGGRISRTLLDDLCSNSLTNE